MNPYSTQLSANGASDQVRGREGAAGAETWAAAPNIRLLHIWAAGARLDKTPQEILQLIESGELLYAFDVGQARRRREVRVLSLSVDDYLDGQLGRNADWGTVAEFIWPACIDSISACELARTLSCKTDSILNLVRMGELRTLRGTLWRPGPGGSPQVERESAMAWLQKRRLL